MKAPFPSLTPTWHNDAYPAIDYTNSRLRHQGETVIITGAGSGIGREVAVGFATAGAKHLVLVGRNELKLNETSSAITSINTEAKVSIFTVDVTDEAAVKAMADRTEQWNVLIHAAGYINSPVPVAKADIADYWKSYEVNVKSTIIAVKYLLPKANPNAAVLTYVGGSLAFPTQILVGLSGYLVAKMALVKTMEYLAHENPGVFFAAVHPGMVDTDIFRRSGATPDTLPVDSPRLSAGFSLWITLPEAKFLTGRLVWANWDVDELKAMEKEITSGNKLTLGYEGWPFSSV